MSGLQDTHDLIAWLHPVLAVNGTQTLVRSERYSSVLAAVRQPSVTAKFLKKQAAPVSMQQSQSRPSLVLPAAFGDVTSSAFAIRLTQAVLQKVSASR